jgi:hypothetical protein
LVSKYCIKDLLRFKIDFKAHAVKKYFFMASNVSGKEGAFTMI